MKRYSATFFSLITAGLLLTSLVSTATAQGRYRGRRYSKGDVDRIIKRVEDRSDSFKRLVDRSLDRSRLDGTRREDRINDQVADLETSLDDLRREFDRKDSYFDTRAEVERVMREAEDVNGVLRRLRFNNAVQREWALVRADLNKLAGVYNLRLLR
jgi:hypothetical protein